MNAQKNIATEDRARDKQADHLLPMLLRPQMANRSAGNSRRIEMVKVT